MEVAKAQDYDRRADKPWTRLSAADKVCEGLSPCLPGGGEHFPVRAGHGPGYGYVGAVPDGVLLSGVGPPIRAGLAHRVDPG